MKDDPDALRGELVHGEPLARHTSLRVGGPARRWYRPADRADLVHFLATLDPGESLLMLGLGSNLLVRDGGFPGTVIALHGRLAALSGPRDGCIEAEAGVPCAKIARLAARAGLAGAEFLAGIPGTLGGALAMNAGAWGGETWTHVAWAETVDRRGVVRRRPPADFTIGYRSVRGPRDEWFIAAGLVFERGEPGTAQPRIRSLLERRARTQPLGLPNCGSVFRNPPGDHAARLIEAAGLKGHRIGNAEVSMRHANFIVNTGGARAADVEALIAHVAATVAATSGVRLVPEVCIVGEP